MPSFIISTNWAQGDAREPVIVLWEGLFVSRPFIPTHPLSMFTRVETLPLLQVVGSWTSCLPKDLKAESEGQHPYPVKVSKSGWHTACPVPPS